MSAIDVELISVSKSFGPISVVTNIDLKIPKGEFVSILGPSGCGKTTTLNMIAGFSAPSGGDIRIRGRSQVDVPPERRNIGLVFQNYALFPHMTVAENVGFGLRMKGTPKNEIGSIVQSSLRRVHLDTLADRYPRALSGGQQQRVALARALAPRPSVLLLDEPLSNLDLKLREAMRAELKEMQQELGMTFIYVTHDQEEAMAMSDRIVVMWKGVVAQQGDPGSIYGDPQSTFVADFIGKSNILTLREVTSTGTAWDAAIDRCDIRLRATRGKGDARYCVIRPQDIQPLVDDAPVPEDFNVLRGMLRRVINLGASLEMSVELAPEIHVSVLVPSAGSDAMPAPGQQLKLGIPACALKLLAD
ncbi:MULTISPECIES: ABC transporter ATP-binding protein [unclassified Rhizobium]|uniref:ABC transporter ATP-binding protein n=1 Tax=unclassified Rhizobium TaxID=2613769 RepID=UPI00146DA384|nr:MULTISPECIES: ABC transporter ATP-binding protein [unclassified Rhizobium]MBD9444923.1 ABC transporter ATP-binding protein [Rhizobium sp. RHZ01]NMN69837.1 putative spermidine/putrescine transport system ATP-binding protein [Rhizobium sp. 57MFTsu3.2]